MRSAPKSIMLVEDNPDDIELTLRALEEVRFADAVRVARDGAEALAHLFDHADPLPELVLLDLKLPKVDGLEVLRRIRADPRTRYLSVVVLTSSSEQQDLIQSYDLGANSFVQKPVSFDEFVEATRQLGVYWLTLNRSVACE